MSFAWETTTEDVLNVLRSHQIDLSQAEVDAITSGLDTDQIEEAVLSYDGMDTQTNAAYSVIEDQLKGKGVIPLDAEKEWPMPSEEEDWDEDEDE